jgi:predicted membrane protein
MTILVVFVVSSTAYVICRWSVKLYSQGFRIKSPSWKRLFPLYSLIGLLKGLYSYFEYKNNYIHEIFIGLFWI